MSVLPPPVGAGGTPSQEVQIRSSSLGRVTKSTKDPHLRLWEMDTNRLSVSRPFGKPGHNPGADLIVNEQDEVARAIYNDRAPEKLFELKNHDKLTASTYRTLRPLMDNYVRDSRKPESYTSEERVEIDAFLDACFYLDGNRRPRPMMKYVYDHLLADKASGGLGLEAKKFPTQKFSSDTFGTDQCMDLSSYEAFQESVRNIWFGIYTNNYRGRQLQGCSGFEHIFVGEAGSSISGYHYWLKFLWDEGGEISPNSMVDYGGTAYGGDVEAGMADPNAATMISSWMEDDVLKYKHRGGFFVGVSPEWMVASGTLAMFENIAFHNGANLPFNDRDFRRVKIEGVEYDIATWRNTRPDGSKGMHLRSLWPRFQPPQRDPRKGLQLEVEEHAPVFLPWSALQSYRASTAPVE